jgi:hypothetical protein
LLSLVILSYIFNNKTTQTPKDPKSRYIIWLRKLIEGQLHLTLSYIRIDPKDPKNLCKKYTSSKGPLSRKKRKKKDEFNGTT